MTRADFVRAGRWAAVLTGSAALAACATPQYSARVGGHGPGVGALAQGQTTRPSASGAHGTMAPYQVGGIWYVPREQPDYDQIGVASWYGEQFNLKATADGEIFDLSQFSAAHTTLPLPSMVEVTNLDNGKKLVVRVNDRGPFVGGRIIDLSQAAARELGYERTGTAHVRVRYVGPAPLAGPDAGVRIAKASPPLPAYPLGRVAAPLAAGGTVLASTASTPPRSRRPADEEIFADAAPARVPISVPIPAAAWTPSSAPAGGHRPADEEIFADGAAPAPDAQRPLVAPPQPVSVASLAPLPDAAPAGPGRAPQFSVGGFHEPQSSSPSSNLAASEGPFRIQAGAFGDQDNARRAVAQLASMGAATIEPIQRGGVTLYRVTLPGPADEAEAYGVRDKVAAIGFADARVIRPQSPVQ